MKSTHPVLATILIIISELAGLQSHVIAGSVPTFDAAAAEAARHYHTDAGHDYAFTFVRDVLKAVYDASQVCKQSPRAAVCDIVFIVSSQGRIEWTIPRNKAAFARCIADGLRLPKRVSAPPRDHWAVQLRFVNGPRKVEHPDPPFIVLSLPER